MKYDISEKLQLAAQAYSNNTILRAAVNIIPYIGGSLDVLISSKGYKVVQKRIESLLEQLQRDMSSVKENMIDHTFLESEEWFDLVLKALESAARTRDSEKIRMYSKILRNSVIQDKHKTHSPEDYLMVLAELTPREVQLAKVIYIQQKEGPGENENELHWASSKGWKNLAVESHLEGEDLPFLLKRLERCGLIREITGTYLDYTGGVYAITDVFRKMMRYIS
jgi:DNA-binding ferritin-like protein (Dps family)